MKKYIEQMDRDELRQVWKNNAGLRRQVWEDAIDYVATWDVGEWLHDMERGAADYDIGYCGAWMNVKNQGLFLEWVQKVNSDFGLFWGLEKDEPGRVDVLCERGAEILWRIDHLYLSDRNYEMMDNRLEEICDLFRGAFLNLCRAEYDYIDDDENLFEFWEEESNLCNWYDCFIDDSDGKTPGVLRRVEVIETVFA